MTAMEQITDSPLAMFLVLWAAGHLILVQQLHQTNLKTTEQVFMRFFENRNTHSSNNIRALGNGRDDGSVEGRDAAAAASSGSRGDNGRLLPEETGVQPQADPINNSAARHAPVATLVNDDSSRSHNDKLPQIMGKLEMNTDRAHSLRDEFKRLEKEIHGLSEQCERCTLPEEIDTVIKIYDGKISALVEASAASTSAAPTGTAPTAGATTGGRALISAASTAAAPTAALAIAARPTAVARCATGANERAAQ